MSVYFFALSGRGAERVLLDAAATVVPLVAIVPTMISPGSVPGAVFVLVAVGLALAGQVDRPGTALSLAIAGVVLATVGLT